MPSFDVDERLPRGPSMCRDLASGDLRVALRTRGLQGPAHPRSHFRVPAAMRWTSGTAVGPLGLSPLHHAPALITAKKAKAEANAEDKQPCRDPP